MSKQIKISVVLLTYSRTYTYMVSRLGLDAENSLKSALSSSFEEIEADIDHELLAVDETLESVVISYWGLVNYETVKNKLEMKRVMDGKLNRLENLAFEKLRHRVEHLSPFHIPTLLGDEFIISDLYKLHVSVTSRQIERANFYKLIKKLDLLEPTGKKVKNVDHRPPEIYRFKEDIEEVPVILE